MRWPEQIKAGRVIDDFINLMDLAPTFMEAAGEAVPDSMTGQSLLSIMLSEKSGQVEPERTYIVTGRERHVDNARKGYLPYPQRAIRTNDYIYIINFEPDRWPIGDPSGLELGNFDSNIDRKKAILMLISRRGNNSPRNTLFCL